MGEHGTVGRTNEKTADRNHEMQSVRDRRTDRKWAWRTEMSANTWAVASVASDSSEVVTGASGQRLLETH